MQVAHGLLFGTDMDFFKVKTSLSNRPPESPYEYANLRNDGRRMFANGRSKSDTPSIGKQQHWGEAIRGRIAPMNTTATRLMPSGVSLVEQSGTRLHNVKGANHHG